MYLDVFVESEGDGLGVDEWGGTCVHSKVRIRRFRDLEANFYSQRVLLVVHSQTNGY